MKLAQVLTIPIVLSFAGFAQAQSSNKALAIQLFEDAQKSMAAGNFAEACPKFAKSQELDPALGTQLHLGDCYERVGKTASAWSTFKDAVETANMRNDPRESAARAEVAKLEPTLSKVVIVVSASAPSDLVVRQDGDAVARALWGSPVPVDPGKHQFRAEASGFAAWSTSIDVPASGGSVRVEVPELVSQSAKPASTASAPTPAESKPTTGADVATASTSAPGSTQRVLGYTAGGVGVVGLVVGIVFGLKEKSKLSDRDAVCGPNFVCSASNTDGPAKIQQLTSDARSAATVSTVGFIVGGVGIVGAATLILTAPSKQEKGASIQVGPWFTANAAGAALGGNW